MSLALNAETTELGLDGDERVAVLLYAGGTTVTGGILSVASDANLGAASGGLSLDGGTFSVFSS